MAETQLSPFMHELSVSRASRGRAARAKGRRFEYAIISRLRKAGIQCERNFGPNNRDGNCDITCFQEVAFFGQCPSRKYTLPIAIQCKSVANEKAYIKALAECIEGSPWADAWAVAHSYKRRVRFYITKRATAKDIPAVELSFLELTEYIKSLFRIN